MKVEGYHFDMRKHLLDYDDVLNQQREIIYSDRHAILDESDLKAKILDMVRHEFDDLMDGHLASRHSDDWDVPSFISELGSICDLPDELATRTWSTNSAGTKSSGRSPIMPTGPMS